MGWILIVVNVGVTQLLWFKKVRSNLKWLFIIGILINIGMWTERFVIVVGSLYQDFLPANWGKYLPTMWDIALLHRLPWRVLYDVSAVREIPAVHRHLGSEGCHAAGQSASAGGWRERNQAMSAKPYGILAEFDSPAAILSAAEKVRDAGYSRWDVFTAISNPPAWTR